MKAVNFLQSTNILSNPKGLEGYRRLPVHFQAPQSVSKWKASWRERISILLFGTIFVGVYVNKIEDQPPMWVQGKRNIFTRKKAKVQPTEMENAKNVEKHPKKSAKK